MSKQESPGSGTNALGMRRPLLPLVILLSLLAETSGTFAAAGSVGHRSLVFTEARERISVGGISGTISVRIWRESYLTLAASEEGGLHLNGAPPDPEQPVPPSAQPPRETVLSLDLWKGSERCRKPFTLDESAFSSDGLTEGSLHVTIDDPNPLCSGAIDLEWTGSGMPEPSIAPPGYGVAPPPNPFAAGNLWWLVAAGESRTKGAFFGQSVDQACAYDPCLWNGGNTTASGGVFTT